MKTAERFVYHGVTHLGPSVIKFSHTFYVFIVPFPTFLQKSEQGQETHLRHFLSFKFIMRVI